MSLKKIILMQWILILSVTSAVALFPIFSLEQWLLPCYNGKKKHGSDFMLKFICYPRCTTCQKAQKYLDEKGAAYELRNIKEENPTFEELEKWYREGGLPLKKFFNTSGLLYKSMELKDKLPAMSEEEQLKLLASDGMLVKRPLLIGEDFVLTGFREKEWAEKLGE